MNERETLLWVTEIDNSVVGVFFDSKGGKVMNKIHTITKKEIVLFLLMLVCYIAALVFLINYYDNYALLFFVLHGVLTMVYLYISRDCFAQAILDMKEDMAEISESDIENTSDERSDVIAKLQEEKEALDLRLKELSDNIADITKENEELLDKLSGMEVGETKEEEQAGYNLLLPAEEEAVETDLLPVVRRVCDIFGQQCKDNHIRLELASSLEEIPMKCDERYIVVMLSNIIDNCIKYMNRSGSVVITISDIDGQGIFLVCKDNGNGLDASEVPHIFDLNYQGSNRKSGNGLGLAQVKAVVEHYNGTVYAKSDVGEGMAIYIQFPIVG